MDKKGFCRWLALASQVALSGSLQTSAKERGEERRGEERRKERRGEREWALLATLDEGGRRKRGL